MVKAILFWIVFVGMIVGGIVAGCPLSGTIGVAGLWAIGGAFRARKDGGIDERYNFGWVRFLLGLVCIAIAMIIGL